MKADPYTLLNGLPGEEMIRQGLRDYLQGLHTIGSRLIHIASPRLAGAGLIPPPQPGDQPPAELQLYQLLAGEQEHAHSRFNSIMRELVSFERALDHRIAGGKG